MQTVENTSFEARYLTVWQRTLDKGKLTPEDVAQSRFYFDFDNSADPTPKLFSTFGVVALLPMAVEIQEELQRAWDHSMALLNHPLAYGVEPPNRHVELILFSRPEEQLPERVIYESIEKSYEKIRVKPTQAFTVTFQHPFMTPDGTIVVPGYPSPTSAVDDFRKVVRDAVGEGNIPKRQSQWLHISLGRVLEPLTNKRLEPFLRECQEFWGKPIVDLAINRVLWTHEKQWYMLKRDVLHEVHLR